MIPVNNVAVCQMRYLRCMKLYRHLPNFLTCLNLLCGALAIVCIAAGDPLAAAYLVIVAAVFDFFDGFVARLLKVSSAIGKELDSLADMVTFGVVPGVMLLYYLVETTGWFIQGPGTFVRYPLLLVPLAVPVFSALRLAKFNIDTRQSDSFRGVPTPASALWVISIPLILAYGPKQFSGITDGLMSNQWYLIGSAVVLCALMVSDLPLIAMKFKHYGWQENESRWLLLIISVVLLIILRPLAIPAILLLYVLLSAVGTLKSKKQ